MKIIPTNIRDLLLIEPRLFEDERGFFYESFNQKEFLAQTGINPTFAIGDGDLLQYTQPQTSFHKPSCTKGTPRLLENNFETKSLQNIIHPNCESRVDAVFVQDNHSHSVQGVLRGLHYQVRQPQGKLIRVVQGSIFDVAVDLRSESPTFGQWEGVELSEENCRQLWIPPGFAHGFLVLSPSADVLYKTTDYYEPQYERTILWNDSTLGITWPKMDNMTLSDKDQKGISFEDVVNGRE
ncbi:MAG TPA: dTDP-4-dehydrorhamnose 3,5-epimerase [Chthoniobacterales bacterium]|nr:dTDP-4-dehydrorhamnose 3,5-epimerase [Chthoniobacterales bacterium]